MFKNVLESPITMNTIFCLLIVFVVYVILRKFVVKFIINSLKKLADKWNKKNISMALESLEKPLNIILLVSTLYIALLILPFTLFIYGFIRKTYNIFIIVVIGSGALRILDTYNSIIKQNTELFERKPVFKTLFPLIIKSIKFFIVIIIVVIVSVQLGFSELKSLLAGVGIGGLAVAMAAQDLLKNIFGGFIILTDRSFNTGDFIKIESNEGIVEEVGIRSTKVRTLEQELIVVPNSKFVDGAVLNYSKRGTRRVKQVLGATYSTSSIKLKTIIKTIDTFLNNHSMVLNDTVNVKFDGFGSSSLDIIVMYRINTSDFNEYLKIKEEVNFEIMSIFENEQVEFAFPSVSVYMEK
jgi:MscS family membrane protein